MNGFQIVVLWSDALLGVLLLALGAGIVAATRREHLRRAWSAVFASRVAMASLVVLTAYVLVAVLDSFHFRPALETADAPTPGATRYSVEVLSLLDVALGTLRAGREQSYSAPLATHGFEKRMQVLADGRRERVQPRLLFGGAHLADPAQGRATDIAFRVLGGVFGGVLAWTVLVLLIAWLAARPAGEGTLATLKAMLRGRTAVAWDALAWSLLGVLTVSGALYAVAAGWHVFGTDATGNDVLYQSLKAMRIALLIGTLASFVVLPLGIGLGLIAGYFGGWIDDLIQYVYTVISSIPYVLLIAAAALMMQLVIEQNSVMFDTAAARADARLVALCVIIGAISWTTLCRLLRAETLKLRETDYVQAARCFGVSSVRIMLRHILPNAFHIVLIMMVLEFSGLVLAEAVLSYVGVGVDPTTISFGTMINKARGELARDPLIWWSITAAFVFMVTLVLAANLFAEAVREAFDPRAVVPKRRRALPPEAT
ncbi:MAG: ABC transporter permease [Gammaproteobacteria bacterium]|jgi:peptide/nickel transport system permease protein|nr:ABC transporter permease [Gammaproteobacteria bacterium]MBP6051360.1 ABC transporter permease [Pseudomonadales bacterium]MBK6582867.1 ABC transporter permease [Gammaproteobacteria bacterium]MBK7518996.1 ABC transporter permease [Gammaproteobacteria bacterium]MBK7730262.1 ABC transporter permease [Gammaproteobacteria bacterium]